MHRDRFRAAKVHSNMFALVELATTTTKDQLNIVLTLIQVIAATQPYRHNVIAMVSLSRP